MYSNPTSSTLRLQLQLEWEALSPAEICNQLEPAGCLILWTNVLLTCINYMLRKTHMQQII